MSNLRRPNVVDNTKHLTVALCREKLMQLDEQLEKYGPLSRLVECRTFFERHLERCMKKREEPYHG